MIEFYRYDSSINSNLAKLVKEHRQTFSHLTLLRMCTETCSPPSRLCTFALINMQSGAFLPQCATCRETKMQIHTLSELSVIYQARKQLLWLWLRLYLIRSKARCRILPHSLLPVFRRGGAESVSCEWMCRLPLGLIWYLTWERNPRSDLLKNE